MRWAVAYYEGSLPLVWRDSDEVAWEDIPNDTENVAWVDVEHNGYRQRLMGRDYYWLDMPNGTFGLFNDQDNLDWYGGNPDEQASAWRWLDAGSELIDPEPPVGVHVLRGVMLPDDEWEVARNGD